MCKPASFVVTRGKAYWSRASDSHEDIIKEFALGDLDSDFRNIGIVRVEVVPPDNDMLKPLSEWVFKTDQDLIPDWYDPTFAEQLAREALTAWAAAKLFKSGGHESAGQCYACGNATVNAYDNATVKAWGNATVEAWDNATVNAYGNATVNAYGNATVIKWTARVTVILANLAIEIDRSIFGKVTTRTA
jgi:hypothetical protein